MNLTQRLEDARAEVARLERIAATATCRELGTCDMQSVGGCCASCDGERGLCSCSVPVNKCTRCGDCDYGENDEADEIRAACKLTRDPIFEDHDDDRDRDQDPDHQTDDLHQGGSEDGASEPLHPAPDVQGGHLPRGA